MENVIKLVVAAGGAAASFLFGGWSTALVTLGVFVLIDFATGWFASGREGALSSKRGLIGIARKFMIFAIVALAHLLDGQLGDGHMLRDGAVAFYLANEALSIVENAGRMGVPIPPKVQEMIAVLKGRGENDR